MSKYVIARPSWKCTEDNSNLKINIAKKYPIENIYKGKLSREGRVRLGLCPFHEESNPSFAVYTEKNTWHCFAEGIGGDSISFYMKLTGKNFIDTLEDLQK